MREIRFRGKRLSDGKWVYGSYQADVLCLGKHTIIYGDLEGFYCEDEVDPETVGQYTGLKDRDGQDIYEGDILIDEENGLNVVRWGDGQYLLEVLLDDGDYYTEWLSEYNEMCRVIGNVYENPELLKGDENA